MSAAKPWLCDMGVPQACDAEIPFWETEWFLYSCVSFAFFVIASTLGALWYTLRRKAQKQRAVNLPPPIPQVIVAAHAPPFGAVSYFAASRRREPPITT